MCFLFFEVLRCFTSLDSPSCPMYSDRSLPPAWEGLPHSETPGSMFDCNSPGTIAGFLRPSSALCAKASTNCSFLRNWLVQFSRCGHMKPREGAFAPSKLDSERGTVKRRCSLKGGDPGARSRTPTLLRLNPPYRPHLRHPTGNFGCNRLGWFDGRCVQGPGTYSPQ